MWQPDPYLLAVQQAGATATPLGKVLQEQNLNDARVSAIQSETAQNEYAMSQQRKLDELLQRLKPEDIANITPEALGQIFQANPALGTKLAEIKRLQQTYAQAPSAVQEYEYYKNLPPEEQGQYLGVKRSNQTFSLGDTQAIAGPQGNIIAQYPINVKPDNAPELKGQQAEESAAGKVRGEATGAEEKKAAQATDIIGLISEARKVLPQASSGRLEKFGSDIANVAGYSTGGSQANRRLEVLSAALTSTVPRFEGPQGVLDVEIYKQAAADVANASKPIEDRLAALDTMETLQKRYTTSEPSDGDSGGGMDDPPIEGARQAPDGNWYVQKDGMFYRVD